MGSHVFQVAPALVEVNDCAMRQTCAQCIVCGVDCGGCSAFVLVCADVFVSSHCRPGKMNVIFFKLVLKSTLPVVVLNFAVVCFKPTQIESNRTCGLQHPIQLHSIQ